MHVQQTETLNSVIYGHWDASICMVCIYMVVLISAIELLLVLL